MSRILLSGIAVLDIINYVDHYPHEDEEMRAINQRIQVGGNASNMAMVLAQVGHECALSAVVADESDGRRIIEELNQQKVDTKLIDVQKGKTPVSYINVNQTTGSRTIVHYRELPELSHSVFQTIAVNEYDWLHFEGRNMQEVYKMLAFAKEQLIDQPISIEIEKNRGDMQALLSYADVVMFSKVYARSLGFATAGDFLVTLHKKFPRKIMSCAWGEQGAYAIDQSGKLVFVAAPPTEVVDSVGAGDVFNAGLIHALSGGALLAEALELAVNLASKKVGQTSIAGLF
jgi:ketohexokinase